MEFIETNTLAVLAGILLYLASVAREIQQKTFGYVDWWRLLSERWFKILTVFAGAFLELSLLPAETPWQVAFIVGWGGNSAIDRLFGEFKRKPVEWT